MELVFEIKFTRLFQCSGLRVDILFECEEIYHYKVYQFYVELICKRTDVLFVGHYRMIIL